MVHPHAKINLGLRVLRLRSDGYHEIRTRFQTIDLTDEMEIRLAPRGVRLRVEGADLPSDRTNLVLRAAEALREGRRGLPGASIRLLKSIPLAAGLGGGSSDAAATLLALDRLWGLDLGPAELHSLAAGLGADVPFFLEGGTVLGEGKGERLRPLPDLSPCRVLLVLAPYGSSTAEVYRRWRPAASPADSVEEPSPVAETAESVLNDLETVVFAEHPELGELRELLYRAGAMAASLSGSGPTLFGLFRSGQEAGALRRSRDWAPFRVVECAPVGKEAYRQSLGVAREGPDGGSS